MARAVNSEKAKILDMLYENKVEDMREYLDEGGNANYIINGEITPIGIAKTKEMAELLIDRGANIRVIGYKGYTPLLWQANESNPEVIQVLLNKEPLLIYDRSGFRDDRETALHKCIRHAYDSSFECVKILLAHKPKIDINGVTDDGDTDEGLTPLDYAVQTDNVATKKIIKLLIDNGAYRMSDQPSKYDDFIRRYNTHKRMKYNQAYRGLSEHLPENVVGVNIKGFVEGPVGRGQGRPEYPSRNVSRKRKARKTKARKSRKN